LRGLGHQFQAIMRQPRPLTGMVRVRMIGEPGTLGGGNR
jgi:hypothetical protein